jgi:hypothetical protein
MKREIERKKRGKDKEKWKERELTKKSRKRKRQIQRERKIKNWTRARHRFTQLVYYNLRNISEPREFVQYKMKRPVASASLVPFKEFCCGFTVATCSQQCASVNKNGFW